MKPSPSGSCVALLLFVQAAMCGQAMDTVRLSSLELSGIRQGWGRPKQDRSVAGNVLTIGGKSYTNGIGTHAISKMKIALNQGCTRFVAEAGVDDDSKGGSGGTSEFSVMGNGKLLWKSPVLHVGERAVKVDVDVSGVDTLLLYVGDGGDGIGWDHADWADAYFLVKGPRPTAVVPRKVQPYLLTPVPPDRPRLTGPKVFGARPGNPFLFTLTATGVRPRSFEVSGLPAGLTLDPLTGRITGMVTKAGRYQAVVRVRNAAGEAQRPLIFVIGDTIALTPPLGWNSWNCFAEAVDAQKVKDAADALVASGLADHGWSYINIDDCWMVKSGSADSVLGGPGRNPDGSYRSNRKFPDMKELADYVHSRGLKIGLYSSPGLLTCAGYMGCYGHEEQDARTFADWGFDYLKYDWCSYDKIAKDHSLPELKKPYAVMRAALDKAPRDIVFSLCQYGMGEVWQWGESVGGNCWRTTGDIDDSWQSVEEIGFGQAGHEVFAGPGHWNDPDMLVVGQVGWGPELHPTTLSPDEQYTHISLWSLLASPMLIGCDMTRLDPFTLNLLTNDEVLEINQDPLGIQARRVAQRGETEIWAKTLEDKSVAVGLFNRGDNPARVSANWSDLGLTGLQLVRDVWRQKNLGEFQKEVQADVPAHGVVLLKCTVANRVR
jgi:alpha-galactosidase